LGNILISFYSDVYFLSAYKEKRISRVMRSSIPDGICRTRSTTMAMKWRTHRGYFSVFLLLLLLGLQVFDFWQGTGNPTKERHHIFGWHSRQADLLGYWFYAEMVGNDNLQFVCGLAEELQQVA